MINIARIALAITMILTFPFAFMVVRMACARVLDLESQDKVFGIISIFSKDQTFFPPQPMSTRNFVLVSFVLFAILQTIGCFVTDLGIVYSLFGGLWAVAISYFFPSILYIYVRLVQTKKKKKKIPLLIFHHVGHALAKIQRAQRVGVVFAPIWTRHDDHEHN